MPNALQPGPPSAGNPLAQAQQRTWWPTDFDKDEDRASGTVEDTSKLQQWLAEQRAKHEQQKSVMQDALFDMLPNTARVPPDTMSDVNPFVRPAPVNVGEEGTSPVYPSNQTQLVDRLMDYDVHGQSFNYADAIMRAMDNRRRLGRQ